MPGLRSFFRRLPLFPLFSGISLAIGLVIPSVFEWTQKPASRSRHVTLEHAAAAVLVITMFACSFVMWRRRNATGQAAVRSESRKLQFGLRDVFVAITIVAVVLAMARLVSPPVASGGVIAVVSAIVGWAFACDRPIRSRVGLILANMYLPLAWMIAFNVPFGRTSGLAVNIPLGPGIVLAELLRELAGLNRYAVEVVGAVVVIGELLLGAWLARRGGRLSVIYAILVLISSSLGSLLLHALYRA